MPGSIERRAMLGLATRAWAALVLGLAADAAPVRAVALPLASGSPGPHPDPRPGIDASRMTSDKLVRGHPSAVAAFDEARTIPEVLDGIRCQCGCADADGMRSLLTCYEGDTAMALDCIVCRGEARLAYRLHRDGRSLDEIRASIDARYGT
jgi:hypothetical protein